MKFSTDELMPFFEVRTGMSKHLDDVQAGKEIVITRHDKPEGALVWAEHLYRYRELERVITELTALLKTTAPATKPDQAQKALFTLANEASKLLAKSGESKPWAKLPRKNSNTALRSKNRPHCRLSLDLTQQFGRGFSARNLEQMRQFYLTWAIPQTPSAELPMQLTTAASRKS